MWPICGLPAGLVSLILRYRLPLTGLYSNNLSNKPAAHNEQKQERATLKKRLLEIYLWLSLPPPPPPEYVDREDHVRDSVQAARNPALVRGAFLLHGKCPAHKRGCASSSFPCLVGLGGHLGINGICPLKCYAGRLINEPHAGLSANTQLEQSGGGGSGWGLTACLTH